MAGVPEVDLSECTRCDACCEVCPEVFRMNEAGYIEVLDLTEYPEECVQEAIRYCPADCITWRESQ
ncbi:MAG: ferredoxin [Deltaproteobacteria bacterium]|nr:ferredoxin [Deltaproteobacteria bacterium]